MLLKTLVILVLAVAVFGTAGYYAYELFVHPKKALEAERRLGPAAPPPDPSLPEFKRCMEVLDQGDALGARYAFEAFVDHSPQSTKLGEAKDKLGEIHMKILLSQMPAPEKQVYLVRPNDVLNKVARITRTPPELLMRANGLGGIMLRIGQKLYYTPVDFSLAVSRKRKMLTLLEHGKFFKQYPIRNLPGANATARSAGAPPLAKLQGKVVEKIAWGPSGGRVIFSDKEYANAAHWISISVPGHSIYSDPDPATGAKANRPPSGGIGIEPAGAAELGILLSKGNPVTID